MCERTAAECEEEPLDAAYKKRHMASHGADVQRTPHVEEDPHPPHAEGEEEDSQSPRFKEEEEELWITQEGNCLPGQDEVDLTKLPLNVVSVKIEEHEEKPAESSQLHHSPNIQQLIDYQEKPSPQLLEHPHRHNIKEEEDKLWITQEEECLLGQEEADLAHFPLTVVCVKTEDHEDGPPESSQLHGSPNEENRAVEHPSSSSPQHMTTEAERDHCESLLAPLSDSDDASDVNANMEPHIKTQAGEKPFSCPVCAKGFLKSSHVKQHMHTHTGERPFSCSICHKRFSNKSNRQNHMRTHTGEKPFSCSVCDERFYDKYNMQIHTRRHTGEAPFMCSVCAKSFIRKYSLTRHMQTHTEEKPFRCSVCGKRFSVKNTMQIHMRRHTGERPFSCSVCEKRFLLRSDMKSHMRKHTGEHLYSCSLCAKSYVKKSFLTRHMRAHTGEKPFSCSVCAKRYTDKRHLQTHLGTHTGE